LWHDDRVIAVSRGVPSRVGLGVALLGIVLGVLLTELPARAQGAPTASAGAPVANAGAARTAAEGGLGVAEGEDEAGAGASLGLGGLARRGGWLSPLLLGAVFYFLFMRNRGSGGGWGSYYLFWIVAPAIIAAVSSHPAVLLVVAVGFLCRRWLPDPFLFLRYWSRINTLETEVRANASNVTARRDLASIWLEKHRPRRALPLLAEALARDPEAKDLRYLLGLAQLQAGEHEKAVETLIALVQREPGFRYGEAYLRAADALIALERWDDAEDALERFARINSSNIEGRYKRARVMGARKDDAGRRDAVRDVRDVWQGLPSFQRRNQLGWYIRARLFG
jgi:tetratricopeptide (TPR) repeat protein